MAICPRDAGDAGAATVLRRRFAFGRSYVHPSVHRAIMAVPVPPHEPSIRPQRPVRVPAPPRCHGVEREPSGLRVDAVAVTEGGTGARTTGRW